jgi:hypothetical protein
MRLRTYILVSAIVFALPAHAIRSSYRNANPVGWMHMLPVGEMPGWSGEAWANLEINHANIWNMQSDLRDKRTGAIYTYKADYEQSSAILELGAPVSEDLAFTMELPYANRNGGFLDDFIDQFHQLIQSDRFLRHLNDDFANSYVVKKDGMDQLATEKAQGMGSAKAKLKYWPLKWLSPTPGVCDCGFAISAQAKFSTQSRKFGLSSGSNDYTGMAHLGVPLGQFSAAWATAALSKLGPNDTFAGWPRREWLQMYELSLDLAVGPAWGLMLQARTESPLFRKEQLDFQYTTSNDQERTVERVASAWNALTAWRGSQAIGFRYRWGQGSQVNLLFVEDWGTGDKDDRGEWLYVNNAPDIALINSWHFVF